MSARKGAVLILVLMEDALVLVHPVYNYAGMSLNPCFNGRCTRTLCHTAKKDKRHISLNPCFNGRCTRTLL